MDHLFTPWRRDYIVNPKPEMCPFCEALQQDERCDRANLLLLRSERAFIILNRYPYNNGHLMVLPNLHVSDLDALDAATQAEIMQLTAYCTRLLKKVLRPQGFNVGINLGKAAGAGLEAHLHIHIVPRWQGDTNFMPVVAETRVLPEWLDESYRALHDGLLAMPYLSE